MIDKNNYAFLGRQTRLQDFEKLKKENYSKIYAHEAAHKAAAGSLGGPIVIEYNKDGTPTGGHVSIKIPTLNKENPTQTLKQAEIVKRAALAPGSDLSDADLKVAKTADRLIIQAKALQKDSTKNGKKLDINV